MYYLKLVYCGLHGRIWSVLPFNACIIWLSMTSLTGSPSILESYWLASSGCDDVIAESSGLNSWRTCCPTLYRRLLDHEETTVCR